MNEPKDFQGFQTELNDLINKYGNKLDQATVIGFLQSMTIYIATSNAQKSMLSNPDQIEQLFQTFFDNPKMIKILEKFNDKLEIEQAKKEGIN